MISFCPQKLLRFLAFFVLGLTGANLIVQIAKFFFGYSHLWGLSRLFDVNGENNIPTWYSSTTLLLCALLLWVIAEVKHHHGDRYTRHWKGLSIIFMLLSLDETASLHDLLNPLGTAVNASGFFLFIWVVPGIIFVLSVLLFYWRFLMNLPAKTRYLILLSGVIYVFGAIGLEMIGGNYFDQFVQDDLAAYASGWDGMTMALFLAVEELLEMMGILVFVAALLSYISVDLQDIHTRVDSGLLPSSNHSKRLEQL